MEIIGIIAEYNPFHNGHIYHINKIKEMYPDSILILVLNGYFLERGEISLLTKENKAKIALDYGVNIVLELPFIYGTQSADTFANMSIKLLNKLNVNKIIFGSECADITILEKLADTQLEPEFGKKVKAYLDEGINYPTALAKATKIDFEYKPNDLLGISYIKAIKENKFNIKQECIKRTNHDLHSNEEIISASNIRNKLKLNENISKYLPNEVIDDLIKINKDMYFNLLKSKIITDDNLNDYLDVDEGIEYRLKKNIITSNNIDEFIDKVKTKRYTYNKLNRMFIHILTSFTKEDAKDIDITYIKVLGFNSKGKTYLKKIKKDINIPLITSYKNMNDKILNIEYKVTCIYSILVNDDTLIKKELEKPIIIE